MSIGSTSSSPRSPRISSSSFPLSPPRRRALDRFAQWVAEQLAPTDAVVLEATTNAWEFNDQLQPLVASVTIAHPYLVKLVVATRVKTAARDTVNLARLLAAGRIPAVWVPPKEVRELRMLVAHRRRLIQQRTRARNRLRSVLHQHNLVPPSGGGLFATEQRAWWSALNVSVTEQLRLRQELAILDHLEPLLSEVETELTRLRALEPWASQMPFLLQLPGLWMGAIDERDITVRYACPGHTWAGSILLRALVVPPDSAAVARRRPPGCSGALNR